MWCRLEIIILASLKVHFMIEYMIIWCNIQVILNPLARTNLFEKSIFNEFEHFYKSFNWHYLKIIGYQRKGIIIQIGIIVFRDKTKDDKFINILNADTQNYPSCGLSS